MAGFADDWNSTCKEYVFSAFEDYSVGSGSPRLDAGTNALHKELERKVAEFVGKEDAFVFNMGYGTNSTVVPALMGPGSLILSDSLNHVSVFLAGKLAPRNASLGSALGIFCVVLFFTRLCDFAVRSLATKASIVNGARGSGATVRVFRHNDAKQLDKILRESIVEGRPRSHRAWTKILVMVEGVYSMEGQICDLKSIVAVAKKSVTIVHVQSLLRLGETAIWLPVVSPTRARDACTRLYCASTCVVCIFSWKGTSATSTLTKHTRLGRLDLLVVACARFVDPLLFDSFKHFGACHRV